MADELNAEELARVSQASVQAAEAVAALQKEMERLNKTGDEARAIVQAQVNVLTSSLHKSRELTQEQKAHNAVVQEQIRLLGKLRQEIFSLSSAYDTQKQRIRGLMGINEAWKTSTTGVMVKIIAEGGKVSDAFASITSQMRNTASSAELVTSSYMKLQETGAMALGGIITQTYRLAESLDSSTVALARTSGASQRYSNMIPDMESRLYKLGVTGESAAQAVGSLYSGMTGFTQMAASTRVAVADSVAVLERMGISTDVSARNLDIMNRSMGMSGQQAMTMNEQLFSAAQNLGISTTKMLGDFGAIGPQLIKFGQEATRVYIGLQSVAKNTGLEISRLLSITEQFDQFDSAAESVGQLNAILGGPYLNTIQMVMTTDPTQRLQLMSRAVKDAGMNFDSMSYYMRQATASAMGLQDVNELAMLMRGRMDLLGNSTMQSSRDIEQMMIQTNRYNTVAEEMRQVMRMLAIELQPLIAGLKNVLHWMQEHPGAINGVVAALAGFKILNTVTTSFAMARVAMNAFGAGSASLMARLAPIAIAVVAIATAFALFSGNANRASESVNKLHSSVARLNTEQAGLSVTSQALGTVAANIAAVPKAKVVQFTHMLDKSAQAGRVENAGSGIIQNQVAAMYRPAPPSVQVRQPIKVEMQMDSRSVGSQIIDVMLT